MTNASPHPSRFFSRTLAAAAVLGVVVSSTWAGSAQSIRLHDQAAVASDQVRLRDVAQLQGPNARTLGDIVLITLDPDEHRTTVTLTRIRQKLSQHGVNWGKLVYAATPNAITDNNILHDNFRTTTF